MATILDWVNENPKAIAEIVAFLFGIAYILVEKYDLQRYKRALDWITAKHEIYEDGQRVDISSGRGPTKKNLAADLKYDLNSGILDPMAASVFMDSASDADPKKKVSKAKRFWRRWLWPAVKTVAGSKIKAEIMERLDK